MASVTSGENKNIITPDKSADKIECKSLRSIFHIVNYLENEIASVLNQNGSAECEAVKSKILQIKTKIYGKSNDVTKGDYSLLLLYEELMVVVGQHLHMVRVYKASLSGNITCEGQPVTLAESELNTTSEYEPFDGGKEQYINHVLMGQLEQQMVATAALRKNGPAQVHSKLKKLIRPELKHLCTVEVQPSSGENDAMETDALTDGVLYHQESLEERLQGTRQLEQNLQQMCADMLHKAKDLSKAVHIYHRSESSEFQKALCETPPTTPEVSDQNCLQMSKLDKNVSKKLPI